MDRASDLYIVGRESYQMDRAAELYIAGRESYQMGKAIKWTELQTCILLEE